MAKKKKGKKSSAEKPPKKSTEKTKRSKITMPGKPKDDFDLEINDKSHDGYIEYDCLGENRKIYVDVPNKVGKTLRIRQVSKESGTIKGILTVRTINGLAKITPKMKFLDLVKMGNVWAMIPRFP